MSVMRTSMWGVCKSEQEPNRLQGTSEQAAWALLAEQLPNPALLAAEVWGGSHFEEFKISFSGISLWSAGTLVPTLDSVPSAPGRAAHAVVAANQDPRTAVLSGEGAVSYLTLGAMGAATRTESDSEGCRSAHELRAPGVEKDSWGNAECRNCVAGQG